MLRFLTLFGICLQALNIEMVESLKQQVQLSDSYLPVAMQVIAHLTDQMAYEVKEEQPTKPTTKRPIQPSKPLADFSNKPNRPSTGNRPNGQTTPKPVYVYSDGTFGFNPLGGWFLSLKTRFHQTTPFHKPGYYAPVAPPKPSDRLNIKGGYVLLPMQQNSQYTVIEPRETRTEEPLLTIHHEEVRPLMEPAPDSAPLLPPSFENFNHDDAESRSEDELFDEENLQYLSENVRDMIRMANDVNDERLVDVWDGLKGGLEQGPKGQMSASNLRLLLLYDLLSREAKRQRLNDYSGFSPDVMGNLVESSGGGARAQLSFALSKMVERRDCGHEYANNRAKEMVEELAKDESKLSSELRYLQPIVYRQ